MAASKLLGICQFLHELYYIDNDAINNERNIEQNGVCEHKEQFK